jgi:hypothetical protein
MLKKVLALSLLAFLPALASAANSYVCTADKSVGFAFDKATRTWKPHNFIVRGSYRVQRSTTPGVAWEVKEGAAPASIQCRADFSPSGSLACNGFREFRMNRNTGRFIAVYLVGYWTDDPGARGDDPFVEGMDTPTMQLGRCVAR